MRDSLEVLPKRYLVAREKLAGSIDISCDRFQITISYHKHDCIPWNAEKVRMWEIAGN